MLPRRIRVASAAALLGAAGGFSHAADQSALSAVKIPPHQRYTLPNGVKLILIPRHDVPLIAFDAVLRGGARLDPAQRAGLSALTSELLTHGAGTRDAYAFADAVEDAGGHFEAGSDAEAIFLHGEFLARDHALMLELLTDALQRPRFEASELDKLRERHIEFIKAAKDSAPQRLIGLYGRSLLFGEHPYGRPVGGSETSLHSITREDLQGFYRAEFGADRLTLVVAGDFEPAALKSAVTAAFASWHKAPAALAPLSVPPRVHGRRVLLIDSPGATQTYIWIANVGVDRSYPQRAALDITDTAFGGSFGSMLTQALRVKSGLSYSAHANFHRGSVPAEFAISTFTQTQSTAQAIELALQTLARLKGEGLSDGRVQSARSYLLGQYALGFETAADWAGTLADLDLYGLPDSYIDDYRAELLKVTAAEAKRVVAAAYPDSEDVDIVLIGDAARIRAEVAKFGPVLEKPIEAPDFSVPES